MSSIWYIVAFIVCVIYLIHSCSHCMCHPSDTCKQSLHVSSIWYIVAVIACVIHLIHSCSLLMYIYKFLEVLFSISIISPLHSQMCCNSWQPLKWLHAWWWPAFQWGWHGLYVCLVSYFQSYLHSINRFAATRGITLKWPWLMVVSTFQWGWHWRSVSGGIFPIISPS